MIEKSLFEIIKVSKKNTMRKVEFLILQDSFRHLYNLVQ